MGAVFGRAEHCAPRPLPRLRRMRRRAASRKSVGEARVDELDTRNRSLCAALPVVVPAIYHSIGATATTPATVAMNQHANRHFRLNYHDDASGGRYVARACGADVSRAYNCLAAGQLRADLFRFCAAWSEGGLYLDSDLIAIAPFDALYAPCAALSVGIDGPTGEFAQLEQAQMKVLAARRGSLTARCMVDAIVARVIERWTPSHPANILNLSGPALLAQCCRRHAADEWIVRTYEDRRNGAWPHTGMLGYMAANTLGVLAWETPSAFHFPSNPGVRDDYTWLSREGLPLYTDSCELPFADSRGVA